jgi:hypothetical protein
MADLAIPVPLLAEANPELLLIVEHQKASSMAVNDD